MRFRSVAVRRGAGLFGLLVLLAVLALLLALLLPAVQKVREAANRMHSQNNLKQIGLAIHGYHNDFNCFPTAGTGAPKPMQMGSGSWCFRVLPYLEANQLYQSIENGQPGNVPVGTYYIMGRRPVQLYNGLPKIDYAGCVGTAEDPEKPPAKEDGIFVHKGKISIAHVLDGTSNTLMVGEKWLSPPDYLTGQGDGDKESCWVGGKVDALRSSNGDKRPPQRDVMAGNDFHRGFGSPFPGGCNFLFGDGSVRSIRFTIKPKTFEWLCSRDDGNPIDPRELE
jgi:prepilin-type processing-associated H-X9-DG protein